MIDRRELFCNVYSNQYYMRIEIYFNILQPFYLTNLLLYSCHYTFLFYMNIVRNYEYDELIFAIVCPFFPVTCYYGIKITWHKSAEGSRIVVTRFVIRREGNPEIRKGQLSILLTAK